MGGDITRTREVSLRPWDAVVSVWGWLVETGHDVDVDVGGGGGGEVALHVPNPTLDGVFGPVSFQIELHARLPVRLCEASSALRDGC